MGQPEIRREALARQGTELKYGNHSLLVPGDQARATFEQGSEGLVQLAIDQRNGTKYRIKCFWNPTVDRRRRSEVLAQQKLANLNKPVADSLGGAPFDLIEGLGPNTPFAVIMKNVQGTSWKNLREEGSLSRDYPPTSWPALVVRAIWAYGLATAIKDMERRQFIHADLSPGNVMVTPRGPTAGDMALVDFDAFVHPSFPHIDTGLKGSDGYAASEIWRGQSANIGSDRVGMAILIQEFLVIGDPEISKREAFTWRYDQEKEIVNQKAQAHPFFLMRYPDLARLLIETLRSNKPELRPNPEAWRSVLRSIATSGGATRRLKNVVLEPHPADRKGLHLPFPDNLQRMELLTTFFGIRAVLERKPDGTIQIVANQGAELAVSEPGKTWVRVIGGQPVNARAGMLLFDSKGKLTARLNADNST